MKVGSVKLPVHIPRNHHGVIEISGPRPGRKGAFSEPESTFLNIGCIRHFTSEMAYREFLQNVVDEIVKQNKNSFVGIQITISPDGNVTTFHTGTHIFGVIHQSSDEITFINYGAEIKSVASMMHIGGGRKYKEENQVGEHGEGMKRAVFHFIAQECRVDIYFPLRVDRNRLEFSHINFTSIGNDDDCALAYTFEPVHPFERMPGSKDYNRFQVTIRFGSLKLPKFDIKKWLVPDVSLIRDSENVADHGSILLLPKEHRGSIYARHFFVDKWKYIYYAYDFFMPLGRDRNTISVDDLAKYIAKIWNHAIEADPKMAEMYCREIFMNRDLKPSYFEVSACSEFSKKAIEILRALACPHNKIPIKKSKEAICSDIYDDAFFVTLPDHAVDVLYADKPLATSLATIHTTFIAASDGRHVQGIDMALKAAGIEIIYIVTLPPKSQPVKYLIKDRKIFLCRHLWDHCVSSVTDQVTNPAIFWADLIQNILSSVNFHHPFNRRALLMHLIEHRPALIQDHIDIEMADDSEHEELPTAVEQKVQPEAEPPVKKLKLVIQDDFIPPIGYKVLGGAKVLIKIDK